MNSHRFAQIEIINKENVGSMQTMEAHSMLKKQIMIEKESHPDIKSVSSFSIKRVINFLRMSLNQMALNSKLNWVEDDIAS